MPELLWKAYIDFEIGNGEYGHARTLYRRLLQRTKHVKVWISYAKFEVSIGAIKEAREVFRQAFVALKNVDNKEEVSVQLFFDHFLVRPDLTLLIACIDI